MGLQGISGGPVQDSWSIPERFKRLNGLQGVTEAFRDVPRDSRDSGAFQGFPKHFMAVPEASWDFSCFYSFLGVPCGFRWFQKHDKVIADSFKRIPVCSKGFHGF